MTHFRRRRLAGLLKAFPDLEHYSVLDVGGRPFIWDLLKEHYGVRPRQLVLLNTPSENQLPPSPDYTVKIADGRYLPYADKSFDLVFSNSVIEHVGNEPHMARFAEECNRVGRQIYIQTPNRWFPLEAHFGAAFIHWLPRKWYYRLSFFSMRYFFARNNPLEKKYFQQEFDTTRLLSRRQMRRFFPGQNISSEKVLGLTKSFIVTSRSMRSPARAAYRKHVKQPAVVPSFSTPALGIRAMEARAVKIQAQEVQPIEIQALEAHIPDIQSVNDQPATRPMPLNDPAEIRLRAS